MADEQIIRPAPGTVPRVLGDWRIRGLAVIGLASLGGALGAWLVSTSWTSGPLADRWGEVYPPALGALAAILVLAAVGMPPGRDLVRVRRGGLDGGDLTVNVDNRALTLVFACVLAALAVAAASPAAAPPATPKEPSPSEASAAKPDSKPAPNPGTPGAK